MIHGMGNPTSSAMQIAIDRSGRIVVPKEIREELGLRAGVPLQIRIRDGRVEIEPAPRTVRIVTKGHLRVAEPLEPSEPLTTEQVTSTTAELRARRRKDR